MIKRFKGLFVLVLIVMSALMLVGCETEIGSIGPVGPQGPQGEIGDKGPDGDKGETGDKGPQGEPGQNGTDGKDGQNGTDGSKGPDGDKGETGDKGPQGEPGQNLSWDILIINVEGYYSSKYPNVVIDDSEKDFMKLYYSYMINQLEESLDYKVRFNLKFENFVSKESDVIEQNLEGTFIDGGGNRFNNQHILKMLTKYNVGEDGDIFEYYNYDTFMINAPLLKYNNLDSSSYSTFNNSSAPSSGVNFGDTSYIMIDILKDNPYVNYNKNINKLFYELYIKDNRYDSSFLTTIFHEFAHVVENHSNNVIKLLSDDYEYVDSNLFDIWGTVTDSRYYVNFHEYYEFIKDLTNENWDWVIEVENPISEIDAVIMFISGYNYIFTEIIIDDECPQYSVDENGVVEHSCGYSYKDYFIDRCVTMDVSSNGDFKDGLYTNVDLNVFKYTYREISIK